MKIREITTFPDYFPKHADTKAETNAELRAKFFLASLVPVCHKVRGVPSLQTAENIPRTSGTFVNHDKSKILSILILTIISVSIFWLPNT